jgi:hypothetical protein
MFASERNEALDDVLEMIKAIPKSHHDDWCGLSGMWGEVEECDCIIGHIAKMVGDMKEAKDD